MPMYEFVCTRCHNEFEELVLTSTDAVACPKCESGDVTRLLSRFAFKSGEVFRSASTGGGGCAGCHPGPSGCSSCRH